MAKKQKRLTKRERKELLGKGPTGAPAGHIHCLSCGRHIEPGEFSAKPATASWLTCEHGSRFAACVDCVPDAKERLAEHDRTGQPPKMADAWH